MTVENCSICPSIYLSIRLLVELAWNSCVRYTMKTCRQKVQRLQKGTNSYCSTVFQCLLVQTVLANTTSVSATFFHPGTGIPCSWSMLIAQCRFWSFNSYTFQSTCNFCGTLSEQFRNYWLYFKACWYQACIRIFLFCNVFMFIFDSWKAFWQSVKCFEHIVFLILKSSVCTKLLLSSAMFIGIATSCHS